MKNDKYIQSFKPIEPTEEAQKRMFNQIMSRAHSAETQQVRKGNYMERIIKLFNVKWLAPVAACLVIAILTTVAAPNLLNISGKVIVGAEKDSFWENISMEYIGPVHISPKLQEAMDSAKDKDRIKTVVMVPGFWEYLDRFEVDGMTYWEMYIEMGTVSTGKQNGEHERDYVQELYEKLECIQKMAAQAFLEKAVSDLGIKDAEFETSHYPSLIMILTPAQILSLEQVGCFMSLWSGNQDEPIASNE
ncbi:MAG: hypothetical protein FWH42_05600 [Dehalococcoidia bacterium]|nr:hypothetical protein [Dehalococcoidia bacterium]